MPRFCPAVLPLSDTFRVSFHYRLQDEERALRRALTTAESVALGCPIHHQSPLFERYPAVHRGVFKKQSPPEIIYFLLSVWWSSFDTCQGFVITNTECFKLGDFHLPEQITCDHRIYRSFLLTSRRTSPFTPLCY